MTAKLVYVTAGDAAEAERIGCKMVEARLAACANVHERITSLYWWEGAVQKDGESVLILKTRSELVDALTKSVIAEHSYDCPCVIVLPIEGGNAAFLDWIVSETQEPSL